MFLLKCSIDEGLRSITENALGSSRLMPCLITPLTMFCIIIWWLFHGFSSSDVLLVLLPLSLFPLFIHLSLSCSCPFLCLPNSVSVCWCAWSFFSRVHEKTSLRNLCVGTSLFLLLPVGEFPCQRWNIIPYYLIYVLFNLLWTGKNLTSWATSIKF